MTRGIIRWIALIFGALLVLGCLVWAGVLVAVVWPFGGVVAVKAIIANDLRDWSLWGALLIFGVVMVGVTLRPAPRRRDWDSTF